MTPPRSPVLATAAAAALASLTLAACGSVSPGSSTASGTTDHPTEAQIQRQRQEAISFADCMRTHRVSNFPDPTTSPRDFKFALSPDSGNAQSPAFRSAVTVCQHLLPRRGPSSQSKAQKQAQTVAMLAFARCLRSHGFTGFPDPGPDGQVTREMLAGAGINLHQPALVRAADACVGVTHGLLTAARVARFIAGQ